MLLISLLSFKKALVVSFLLTNSKDLFPDVAVICLNEKILKKN